MSATRNDLDALRGVLREILEVYPHHYGGAKPQTFELNGSSYCTLSSLAAGNEHPFIPCLRLTEDRKDYGLLVYRGSISLLPRIPTEPYHIDRNDMRCISPILALEISICEGERDSPEGSLFEIEVTTAFGRNAAHPLSHGIDILRYGHLIAVIGRLMESLKSRTWNFDQKFRAARLAA